MVATAAGVLLAAGLSGCGAVPRAEVAAKVSEQVNAQGLTTESVSCAGELAVKVGESVRCTVTVKEFGPQEGTAKVTEVDGRTATIDFTLDGLKLGGEPPSGVPTP